MAAMLLFLIEVTGAVRAAGKQMSSCWKKIHILENDLSCTLAARIQGDYCDSWGRYGTFLECCLRNWEKPGYREMSVLVEKNGKFEKLEENPFA